MAKYQVTYKCGHEGVEVLFGKTKDREWKLRSAEQSDCPECVEARRKAEVERLIAEAPELPALIGSEKQVIWAVQIRAEKLKEFDKFEQETLPKMKAEFKEITKEWMNGRRNENRAKWWIDNRVLSVMTMIQSDESYLERVRQIKSEMGNK